MGRTELKAATIYLTKTEYEFIKKEADDHGVTINYFLRALIDQYSPIKLPPLKKRGAQPNNSNAIKKEL